MLRSSSSVLALAEKLRAGTSRAAGAVLVTGNK
jgi:hypothetical protein